MMACAVTIHVYIVDSGTKGLLVQCLLSGELPSVADSKGVYITVAAIIVAADGDGHQVAIRSCFLMREHQIAIEQADVRRTRSTTANAVLYQIILKTGKTDIGDRYIWFSTGCASSTKSHNTTGSGFQHHAMVFSVVPLAHLIGNVEVELHAVCSGCHAVLNSLISNLRSGIIGNSTLCPGAFYLL